MSKESKKMIVPKVPKLRFHEFQDAGEWVESQLGQYLSQHPDYGINAPAVPYSDNLPTYIRITDISEEGYFLRNQMVSVVKKTTDDNYLREGDIVLARTGASVGKSYKYRIEDGKLVFAGFLIRVKPDEKKLNSELLFHFLSTTQYWRWVNFISARSGQPGINGNEYSSMPIPLPPSLKEQQKIADCLSSIDELISAQSQKLEALKAHKKGLMQQIFPAEGESVPKLRFPEFRHAGEWQQLPICEKVDLLSGYPFKSSEISEDSSGIPLMRGINITEGFVRHSQDIDRFFLGSTKKLEKYKLRIDDLVIGMDGSKVGKNSALITENDSDSLLIQRVARLRTKFKATIQFIFQQINSTKFHSYVDRINTSGGIPHISAKQINEFEIYFPNLEEQQKIADFLTSIDELITSQTQKLEAFKVHKKGLMQQLFPSNNNV